MIMKRIVNLSLLALAAMLLPTGKAAAQDAMNGAAPVPGYPMYFNTHSGSYQLGAHYFS